MKVWVSQAELDALDEQARADERRSQRVTLVVPGRDGAPTYTVSGHRAESAFERACRLEREAEAAAATCRTCVLVEVA